MPDAILPPLPEHAPPPAKPSLDALTSIMAVLRELGADATPEAALRVYRAAVGGNR